MSSYFSAASERDPRCLAGMAVPAATLRAGAVLLSVFLLAGILLLDLRTGPDVSLSMLYLAPIVLAAWVAGRTAGIGLALAGSLAWFLWDPSEAARLEAVPLWNLAARLGIFLLVAVSIGTLRRLFVRERRSAAALQGYNEELSRKVAERTEALERSVKEMELFTYAMAHDLRAPLRAVHCFADLLQEEHARDLPPAAQELMGRMAGASRRMDRLILDLLEYGNLIHRPVETVPTPLAPLCRAAVRDLTARIQASGADVQVVEPLPPILGDAVLLARVLRELLQNAITFAAPGRAPRVRIRGERNGDRAIVWVEDNGVGIPGEQRERIFRPFQQLSPAMNPEGTGMGLALARKALDRLQGSIEVVPGASEGSRFRIELRAA